MRIVTLNLWGVRGDWPSRLSRAQQGFRALAADLVALQETVLTDELDQAALVLGPGYHLVHQRQREHDGQGVTIASRWPVGRVEELDLRVTGRTGAFACTCLVTEVLAPQPWGRIWFANHLPDYQLDHEHERVLQALVVARRLEVLLEAAPGHVIVAGDLDADLDADSLRFWTGRHPVDATSVCYRDAWEACHPDRSLITFAPDNPYASDWDWPYRGIDHVLVRCGPHGGPTLPIRSCARTFDGPRTTVSDHYGLLVELDPPPVWPVSRRTGDGG